MLNEKTTPGTRKPKTLRNSEIEQFATGGQNLVQPQAIAIEEAVLGALLLEKNALINVVDILRAEMFYKQEHQRVYEAVVSLFNKTQPVDVLTVANELKTMAALDFVGGVAYLTRLVSRVSAASNVEYHVRILQEKFIKRSLIENSLQTARDSFDDTKDVFEVLDKAEQALYEISETNFKKSYSNMNEILKEALEQLNNRKDLDGGLTGVPSGFNKLDELTSGWQPSDLVILAARPAMGKTAFVISCARNAAVHFKKGVAIFSLEMSAVQLVNRIISAEAEIESEKLKKGQLKEHEWNQLHTRIAALADAPLFIDDTPALSVLELRAKCRRLKAQHDIQIIIIDYLQLMTGETKQNGNREQEIAYISRSLKNLAKELQVPVIALSQLSRDVEKRTSGKKPQLSDLRESGSLEQDADMVLFLYRPEYYGILTDEEGNNLEGVGEIIVAKHRSGALDTVRLKYVGKFTKFMNPDDAPYISSGFNSSLPGIPGGIPKEFEPAFSGNTITLGSKINKPLNDPGAEMPF